MQEEVVATIHQDNAGNVLEVALVHDDATGPMVELRFLSWGTGVGWYRQYTLTLDRMAARTLLRTFGHLRRWLERDSSPALGRQIIPFPAARHTQEKTEWQAL